ncbi:MAG: sulfite exporter TauE/SafE family protein [Fimbriimonadales bacterium]|nr:sulfite exporter TauE/SafE family protein [Fimbriimonadales bacterium]MDW8051177.1 sulfite exporter TauE/SafE family protein [Armatimonadota bacterium]
MDAQVVLIALGILVLAFFSGMLGFGVALASVPYLSLFYADLAREVQPMSIALGGITALLAAIGFARYGYMEWRYAWRMAVIAALTAPAGVWLAHRVAPALLWVLYFVSVSYLLYRMVHPRFLEAKREASLGWALALTVPITVYSTMLGVGVGFLLVPTLIALGMEPKRAAGSNALVVFAQSATAFVAHLPTARLDSVALAAALATGALGAYLGARFTSLRLGGKQVRWTFALLMGAMMLYKAWTLVWG